MKRSAIIRVRLTESHPTTHHQTSTLETMHYQIRDAHAEESESISYVDFENVSRSCVGHDGK